MMILFLVLLPLVLGLLTLAIRSETKRPLRRRILLTGASLHLLGTVALAVRSRSFQATAIASDYLFLDREGLLFLSITSVLFFLTAIYSFGYFHHEFRQPQKNPEGVSHLFTPTMLFFLAAMTLVCVTTHLGILWVAIEATTLASAPLIYYHHHARALEAAWKYLLICSVGIALALLGIFFVAAASKGSGANLLLSELINGASQLNPQLLRIGFILILIGFGTKMGLAPMHSWLPDAHSEAPSPVSALLSGTLLNCAFLGILRFYDILSASGEGPFANRLMIVIGLASMFVAGVFITNQRDYKRMLAYSSIEHMGILALGVGVGARFGSLLHVVNHSVTKALLFFTAGQILVAFRTKKGAEVHGLIKTVPITGILFLVGGLAIVGAPPFAPFVSEFLIFRDGIAGGHNTAMIFYLLFLGFVFVSLTRILLGMVQGDRREIPQGGEKPSWPMIIPPLALAAVVILFGFYLPPSLVEFLKQTAGILGETS